jgi:hypothetical protein
MDLLDRSNGKSSFCRAAWTKQLNGEEEAPENRIIHSRCLQLDVPYRLERVGIRLGEGYFKCGGNPEYDWITTFRVLVLTAEQQWKELLRAENIACPSDNEPIQYYALGNEAYQEVIIEIRRSGVDGWWPSWNIAMNGLILEGQIETQDSVSLEPQSIPQNILLVTASDLTGLPNGVKADVSKTEVRYRTKYFEVGFSLYRTGFTYIALNENGEGQTDKNLLQYPILDKWTSSFQKYLAQGMHVHPLESRELIGYQGNGAVGSVRINGNKILYEIGIPSLQQTYRLGWTVEENRLFFEAEREGAMAVRTWDSSVWSMALDSKVIPTTVIGDVTRKGETGTVNFPLYFHAPKYGTFHVSVLEGEGIWKFDSINAIRTNVHEIKLGEIPQPEGDYLLLPGKHQLKLELKIQHAGLLPAAADTPETVIQAVNSFLMTGLTYRADTNTLSNNGNSMHGPICLDYWSSLTVAINRLKPEWKADELLRDSLERWLTDAPGYAAGRSYHHDQYFEDEYLMSGTSALIGLAEYLQVFATDAWAAKYSDQIMAKLTQMKNRDLDGDGLIESDKRVGVSGQYQWSTNWYDVISFGWKDAWVNAQLYSALQLLDECLPRLRLPHLASGLSEWAKLLKQSYDTNFFNEDTGWYAGWRCKENKLHDYAFLFVNGTAVNSGLLDDRPELAYSIIEKLCKEMQKVGFTEYRFGLPGNLWNIPNADLPQIMHNKPFGTYENGGATLSQARHFVNAMIKVGLHKEADDMLIGFCNGLVSGTAFGGCGSGVDWRMWDGSPCGYEGLLTDQFGVLIPCLERYFMAKRQ